MRKHCCSNAHLLLLPLLPPVRALLSLPHPPLVVLFRCCASGPSPWCPSPPSCPRSPPRRTLPLALLERAKADIPLIEQLEKDHPRMARLFQKGLLPFGVWEQLLEAEQIMDTEVNAVQAEAERLQKGWGQGVFSQAYQMLRQERAEEQRAEALAKEAAVLNLVFNKPSGGVVKITADGSRVTAQTPLKVRKEFAEEEVSFKCEVNADITIGTGDEQRKFTCTNPDLVLDVNSERQWKQIGNDPTQLRLQVSLRPPPAARRPPPAPSLPPCRRRLLIVPICRLVALIATFVLPLLRATRCASSSTRRAPTPRSALWTYARRCRNRRRLWARATRPSRPARAQRRRWRARRARRACRLARGWAYGGCKAPPREVARE